MADARPGLLFLCHRIPYPPDKGDKIRSYRWWRALVGRYRVYLGTFVDDPADRVHVPRIEAECAGSLILPLDRMGATFRGLRGLFFGEPLTLPFYRDRRMLSWCRARRRAGDVDRVLVYSSAMAQYVRGRPWAGLRRVIDFVDVDSDKWRQYAERKAPPLRWVYAREARRLAGFEAAVARELDASLFVSPAEAELFCGRAPEAAARVAAVSNGVDTDYFDPEPPRENPFPPGREPVVFTGAMDYWANVDAVLWLAREVWPQVRAMRPQAILAVVGARPVPEIRGLAGPDILVTGRVPDVRPYLAHARAVVAPLRIARGIQNKVLEGMAMARPVVVTSPGLEGIAARPGRDVLLADEPTGFAARVLAALAGEVPGMGAQARRRVKDDYGWGEAERRLIAAIENGTGGGPRPLPESSGMACDGALSSLPNR